MKSDRKVSAETIRLNLNKILSEMKRDRITVKIRKNWIRFEFNRGRIYRHQLELIEAFVRISIIDLKEECVTGTIKDDYETRALRMIKSKVN